MAVDQHERRVILFASEWELRYFERHHPDVVLLDESPITTSPAR
jgi:peptide subunit release factor RF-3